MSFSPLKILIAGDVCGSYDSLFSKINKVNSSGHGPFTAAFCVGSFFPLNDKFTENILKNIDEKNNDNNYNSNESIHTELDNYISGSKSISIPTYFITANESSLYMKHYLFNNNQKNNIMETGGELCKNLYYLGRCGVNTLHNLKVSYLSGVHNESNYFNSGNNQNEYRPNYNENDVISLIQSAANEPIDILLTSEWPSISSHTNPIISRLSYQLGPRYHFSGLEGEYFELQPYRNQRFYTRFFGLGAIGGPKMQKNIKNLYACNVVPYNSIDKTQFPNDMIECPFFNNNIDQDSQFTNIGSKRNIDDNSDGYKRQRLNQNINGSNMSYQQLQIAEEARAAQANSRFATNDKPPPVGYLCKICKVKGHWIQNCPVKLQLSAENKDGNNNQSNNNGLQPPTGYTCRKCGKSDHYIQQCPVIMAELAERERLRSLGLPPPGYKCKRCGSTTHYITQCGTVQSRDETNENSGPARVPLSYVCKRCQVAGQHFIQNCPIVLEENKQKEVRKSQGLPPLDYICKKCKEKATHFLRNCPLFTNNNRTMQADKNCWFCLSTEGVATHLIVAVGEESYLAIPKGGLNNEHMLILPIAHIENSTQLNENQRKELQQFKLMLKQYFQSKQLEMIIYERNIPTKAGLHLHLNIVPCTKQQAENAEKTLIKEGQILGIEMKLVENSPTAIIATEKKEETSSDDTKAMDTSSNLAESSTKPSSPQYVYFELPSGVKYQYTIDESHPKVTGLFQFPRAVCARIIDEPTRTDWTKCEVNEAEETQLVEQLKSGLQPFDFTGTLATEE